MKPWHDTPMHACTDGTTGPVTPFQSHPSVGKVEHLRCCACGDDWLEQDARIVAHAWWSAGAYKGSESVEYTSKGES